MKKSAVLYVHGKGGNAEESAFYAPLFPDSDIIGLEYRNSVPWDAGQEISGVFKELKTQYENVDIIAVSIGAFFALHAGVDRMVRRAYFISPVIDMEGMIKGMMEREGVTEERLKTQGTIPTSFGEELSWEYLSYVRTHPVDWTAETHVLYGENDCLVPSSSLKAFLSGRNATLTVMGGGEHWFHTPEQTAFVVEWINGIKDKETK